MSDHCDGPTRTRNTTRQREAGAASRAETRRRLVVAAAELFAERGYTATTVTEIARRAGVSVQTLYLACGSKAELLTTVLGQALRGASAGTPRSSDEDYRADLRAELAAAAGSEPGAAGSDPEAVLRGIATVFRRIAERAASWWRTYRDAAAVDREIAEQWRMQVGGRRETVATLLNGLTGLRSDLAWDRAVDTVWTVASPETCDLLVHHADYTFDAYEQWIADTLVDALLPRGR